MAAANNEFFEALSMLEHERGITAEYLIEKIKAAIVIAVKKNYEVEDDHVMVEIDPNTGKFNVALIQDVVADEDWYDEHSEIGITEAQHIRKSYQVGDRVVTPLKTKDFGRIAAQTAKHVIRQGIREAERSQQLSEIQSRAHDIVQATVTRVDPEKGIVALDLGKGGEAILPRNEQVPGEVYTEGQTVFGLQMVASVLKGVKAQDGKLNVNAFAKALETARFKTPLGESAMRADDHQILLPIAVSKVSKDAKFKADNTPMGFQTVKLFSAQEAAAPVQGNCKMQRPG